MSTPTIERIELFRLDPPPPEQKGSSPRSKPWGGNFKEGTPFDRFDDDMGRREPGGIIWVKVTSSDGTYGLGSTDTGNVAAVLIEQSLSHAVIGQEVGAIDACNDRMWHACISFGQEGLPARAIAGIDLALWDLWGKTVNQPVYRLAGGPHKRSLPCYTTGNDIGWAKELGFSKFKLVRPHSTYDGQAGIDGTVEMVAKAREQLGPDADLMLDCWMAYDVDYAVRMCEALRPYNMAWMEEMLPYWDMDGHRALRQRMPWQTMASGEHWSTKRPGQLAVREGLVDLIQSDLKWIGGFSEALKLAHSADAVGIPMALHTGANELFGQHWSFAAPNVRLIEYILFTPPGVPLAECYPDATQGTGTGAYRAAPGLPLPVDGVVGLPPGPGFGLQIPESWLVPWGS